MQFELWRAAAFVSSPIHLFDCDFGSERTDTFSDSLNEMFALSEFTFGFFCFIFSAVWPGHVLRPCDRPLPKLSARNDAAGSGPDGLPLTDVSSSV